MCINRLRPRRLSSRIERMKVHVSLVRIIASSGLSYEKIASTHAIGGLLGTARAARAEPAESRSSGGGGSRPLHRSEERGEEAKRSRTSKSGTSLIQQIGESSTFHIQFFTGSALPFDKKFILSMRKFCRKSRLRNSSCAL
ncbi:uncharacterized protein LOC118645106 isoform X1 [Monomorium pharaonis]|uniref:uncharacterized protein LOC118645106 isoform X1 n=1 Tax=Monomorium pharaonis TaxID=307658 RepID=UPI0017461C34|nr:uncharacterized protein LOC118645106 isoform X1 [Monomorium pharaonis]XP_036141427.1 uncharacterized protein LOC118645106 isoform X1 [Monomorium pharaonis]